MASVLGWYRTRLAYLLALGGVAISLAAAIAGLVEVLRNGEMRYDLGGWPPPVGIEYVLDHLSAFIAVVVTAVALVALLATSRLMDREAPTIAGGPFYGLVLLLIAGLTGIVVTGDLFNLFVFLEIASLSAYALVAVGGSKATVAAFRYLLLGTMGATFYLLGVAFIYFKTGTLNMADAARLLSTSENSEAFIAAAVFITVGLGLKMALFPLHLWLPDAYTYAPSAVTALIAPIMTKVSVYALIRIYLSVFGPAYMEGPVPINWLLLVLGIAGVVAGSVMAFAQQDLRRMLAYSSVSQLAFIALGIGLANGLALVGALLHIMNHAVMKACLFLATGGIRHWSGVVDVSRMAGFGRRMPLTMAALTVGALSMIGIPPTAGFFSKWYLIRGGVEAGNWIAVAVILGSSLLTAAYFFKVLEQVYLRSPDDSGQPARVVEAHPLVLGPILLLAVAIVLLGIFSGFIVTGVLERAAPPWL